MSVTITDQQHKLPVSQGLIKKIINLVLFKENAANKKEISLTLTTAAKIRCINKRFLKKDSTTDVLAFSFVEGKFSKVNPILLGDIVVSADAAIENAKIYKTTPQSELYLYIIHGLLHLLGYDDTTEQKRAVMRKKEQYYLQKCTRTPVTSAPASK